MRVGIGFDAHPLVTGRRLVLGGVEISHPYGLQGHSDGDLLCHAIMDALLGAAALGNKGDLFPSSDPRYKDARSLDLLRQAWTLVKARGWKVGNVDATIVAEAPRLASYLPQMSHNISRALAIAVEQVYIKATTTDGLGFIGRGEGMAALAVVLLEATDAAL